MDLVKVRIANHKRRFLGYWKVGQGAMYFNAGGEAYVDQAVLKDQPWMTPVAPEAQPIVEEAPAPTIVEEATATEEAPFTEILTQSSEPVATKVAKTKRRK